MLLTELRCTNSTEYYAWFVYAGHDMWGTAGAAKRALYIALKHRQLAVDVVTEQDLESVDVMANYEVVYIVDSHIATPAARALIAWIYSGGTLVSTVHGGMRDEADAPSELASVFGVTATQPVKAGVINFIKRDIHAVPKLDSATVNWLAFPDSWQRSLDQDVIEEDRTQAVVGEQSHCSWAAPTQVVATYADSTAAATTRMHGKGIAFWVGWHPGLAYFIDAIPNSPADKGNTDANFNHFVPTQFNNAARELLAMPALASTTDSVPVVVSENLVESGVIDADELGITIVLVNWSAQTELVGLTVTLAFDVPWFTDATLASGRSVVMSRVPHPHAGRNSTLAGVEAYRFTLDLQTTDAIILRKTDVRAVT
jgi:hypothetical protein